MRRAIMVTVMVLLVSACAEEATQGTGSTDGGSSAPSSVGSTAGPVSIAVDDSDIGPVLVDGDGMSLYVYLLDDATSISCLDGCRDTWTPVLIEGKLTLDGVERSLFGRRALDDGTQQLTVDDQPVYRFTGDAEPGDQNGQGVDTLWFMVKPSGLRNTGTPPTPSS